MHIKDKNLIHKITKYAQSHSSDKILQYVPDIINEMMIGIIERNSDIVNLKFVYIDALRKLRLVPSKSLNGRHSEIMDNIKDKLSMDFPLRDNEDRTLHDTLAKEDENISSIEDFSDLLSQGNIPLFNKILLMFLKCGLANAEIAGIFKVHPCQISTARQQILKDPFMPLKENYLREKPIGRGNIEDLIKKIVDQRIKEKEDELANVINLKFKKQLVYDILGLND